ncbi:MAG: PhoH family protein [Spirochaetaceae bacterium]|nr:PhoH family protein [Spirochaetaceae bacterium]MBR6566655.1 PhoH family protein [Spirochaetaceae bacterium]
METSYTIVVPDQDLLSRLCGTNDSNLHLIEKHLGVSVFTQGNELSLGKADSQLINQFQHIVDRIMDEAAAGYDIGPDLVASILQLNQDGHRPEDYRSCGIVISGAVKKVYPKTTNQLQLVRALRCKDMVFCTGPAGSGKTFLMMAEALRLVLAGQVRSLILTRPVVEAGESLGYLPGDLEQKINPYLRPLFDVINTLLPPGFGKKLMDSGVIEVAPLAYMRGRTLNNSVVLLDEAQNTTREQMKMFLTRMGEGSKVFITGDITQIDLPRRTPSGLVHCLEILKDIPEIGMIQLEARDVVRNELVRKIVQAYEINKIKEDSE